MTHMLVVQRSARLRAITPLLLGWIFAACHSEDLTNTNPDAPAVAALPSLAEGERGGIPFGIWNIPTKEMGDVFTGAMRTIWAKELRKELAELKARGARVVVMFAGNDRHYRDRDGHFSLSMWKRRVDAFREVDFSDYVEDGTIIGHYLMDEPNDPENWNGQQVSGDVVEAMAEYSKQLWPRMATIVRAEPGYLARTGGPYRYLDAAWAQYVVRKGTAEDYITRNVADAQKLKLALVTGLNIRKGAHGGGEMSGSLVEAAGRTILANGYACAFLSWEYDKKYLSRSDVREAMAALAPLARAHATKSCRSGSELPPPPPPEDSSGDGDEDDTGGEPEQPLNQTPTAAFEIPSCTAGVPCAFTDGSRDVDGSISSWSWSFGAAGSSTDANPSGTFEEAGSYEVTLTVTDDRGSTASVTRSVRVSRPTLPAVRPIELRLSSYPSAGRQFVRLTWANANGSAVKVFRNGVLKETTRNDRLYVRSFAYRKSRTMTYRVCETGTSRCSNTVSTVIR